MGKENYQKLYYDALIALLKNFYDPAAKAAKDSNVLDGMISTLVKHHEMANISLADEATDAISDAFADILMENGFGIFPKPYVKAFCDLYVSYIVEDAFADTEFEFVVKPLWKSAVDYIKDQNEESSNSRQYDPMVMDICI